MAREHLFVADLEWTGAAQGPVLDYSGYSREWLFLQEGRPLLTGSAAVPFRGDGALPNPEDLLLASVAACHLLSFLAEAALAKIVVRSYRDKPEARMAMSEGRMRIVEVKLKPEIEADAPPARLAELHAKAHDGCFIANSVSFPIRIEHGIDHP